MPACEPLDPVLLRRRLEDVTLWTDLSWTPTTGSTNADLAALAHHRDADGTVRVSEEQTAGRGRFDRRWATPSGASLAFSLLLRPHREPLAWGWLSLLAGMAVATAVERATHAAPGRVELKWPNDVLVDGRKVCGILSERIEAAPEGSRPAAVVGIGINFSLDADELPVPTATSLSLAGLEATKNEVMAELLREFARLYTLWDRGDSLREDYRERCASIGSPLCVMVDEHTTVLGTGVGVDEYGRLEVRTPQGHQTFSAGDVFHLRLQG